MTAHRQRKSKTSKKREGKVPFIRQAEMADCGPACLAMVLAGYGKNIPLEEIKKHMKVGEAGVDALALLETAALYGLKGRGVEANIPALRKLPLPAILHWGKLHFVVLAGWDNDKAEVLDPGFAPMKLGMKEFRQHFSGTVLLFENS